MSAHSRLAGLGGAGSGVTPGGSACWSSIETSQPRTALTSSGAGTRRARGSARRRSARSRHSRRRCNHAPRPGSRAAGSGTHAPWAITTRTSSDRPARVRHPTQVRQDGRAEGAVEPPTTGESTPVGLSGSTLPPRVDPPVPARSPTPRRRLTRAWARSAAPPHRDRRLRPRPPRCRSGCRCASRSVGPRAGRSAPPGRWPGTAGSPAR